MASKESGNKESRVEVEIFGEYHVLKGAESPEYMRMLAQYVNKKMRQVVTRNPMLGVSRAAVLTAINIADELMKLQQDYDSLAELFEPEKKKKEKAK